MTITPIIEKPPEQIVAEKIIAKLSGLGVRGISISGTDGVQRGPIITSYAIKLSASTPLAKIMSKADDLALAIGVESVDIQRQGDKLVIFVPNEKREVVNFDSALFWYLKDEKVSKMKLPILIGSDYEGNNFAIDLVEQPHILVAGSTGGGKSIFISSIIAALSMKFPKENLELYLVDTKRVDLGLFEGIPQLREIAKEPKDWYLVINSIYSEVQHRNRLLEQAMVRNIHEYNAISDKKLPYIVLVIDELADLIEKDKAEREFFASSGQGKKSDYPEPTVIDALKRLIQICRASGVHIIACTQRTSVDIITGTVKSNFPTRISLRLPSSTDSRTILGENGAEKLLGKGDMLIKSADSDVLKRAHCPFVQLSHIAKIIAQQDSIRDSLGV